MKRKEIDADAANTLWALGVDVWFYTDSVGEWKECKNNGMIPFWHRWVEAVVDSNPKLAVEIE